MRRLLQPAAVAAVFLLDRASKAFASSELFLSPLHLGPLGRLAYVENTGVAFGMFTDNNRFFIFTTLALIAALLLLRRRWFSGSLRAELGLALVLGGALGNLFDRVAYGFVVDFVDLSFFPAVFNLADGAITCGGVLLALAPSGGSARSEK